MLLAGSVAGPAGEAQPRHLINLHGRIVQVEQSRRPSHPQYGHYELERILDTFREQDFVVSGELRSKSATLSDSADHVVAQVRTLLASGVPAESVTVVGASMGAAIALVASARLANPEVRFAVLGACLSESVRGLLAEEGKRPNGRVLSIREASDDLEGPCPAWRDESGSGAALVVREIVLETGLGHGFLYRPLPEWVDPVLAWSSPASTPSREPT